jgi:nucleoside-triphosphatase THEP1
MIVAPTPYPILAIVYSDGLAADRIISDLGYKIRDAGIAVAGIVQHNKFIRDRTRCDMEVEELASGIVLQISEDRGKEARGCRMDRGALLEAAGLLSSSLESEPDLLIINKFGKLEAEGRGLRETLSDAVQLGVPIVVGVPYRNIEQWRGFAGGLAEECPIGSSRLHEWLLQHGFDLSRRTGSSALADDDVNRMA